MTSNSYMSSTSMGENKYWITGKDIHKKIITSMIQSFLGPEATVRSYTNNGEDGFLISTPGDCLTDEQIDEICMQSKQMWERQAADRLPSAGGPSTGLKRPLHKPVVISRARPRSSSSTSSHGRRSMGHRSSFHSPSLQQTQQRSRHPYGHAQQYGQQQVPWQYPSQYDQPPSSHYSQPPYSPYDASRDAGDERYSPYPSGHRRQQRSYSGSQNGYTLDEPWGELPTPIGPPSSAQSSERRESIQSQG